MPVKEPLRFTDEALSEELQPMGSPMKGEEASNEGNLNVLDPRTKVPFREIVSKDGMHRDPAIVPRGEGHREKEAKSKSKPIDPSGGIGQIGGLRRETLRTRRPLALVKDLEIHPHRGTTVPPTEIAPLNPTGPTKRGIPLEAVRPSTRCLPLVPAPRFTLLVEEDCDLPLPVEEVSSADLMVAWATEEPEAYKVEEALSKAVFETNLSGTNLRRPERKAKFQQKSTAFFGREDLSLSQITRDWRFWITASASSMMRWQSS